jgi:ABC-type branched-subunit amino acid transport system substrate-binding protein/serine/threonine protein kinase
MDLHCTRPGCQQPANHFPDLDDQEALKTVPQRHCQYCGMPLILDGRYIPLRIIRQGGFGTVFLGCDRRTPALKRCVIKQLYNTSLSQDQLEVATRLFHREAEVLEKLGDHPKIPHFSAFLELTSPANGDYPDQRFFYLVQDYIEGHDLLEELHQGGPLSEAQVRTVLTEILQILEFVHGHQAIHRDIKPSNIVRDLQGHLHLIDFGAVKQAVGNQQGKSSTMLSLTAVFTPDYAPWEQRQCFDVFPSSDLYALAVTCLHLLTGKPPRELFDTQTNRWQWRNLLPQVSNDLAQVLDRMLQEQPQNRFPSATAVLGALAGAPSDSNRSQPWRWGRRPWAVAGLVALALGAGVGAIFLHQSQPTIVGSDGQRVLIANESGSQNPRFQELKAAGVAAMAQKNYPEAIERFQAALAISPNAPETRIYLNNALVATQPYRVIAVPVPLKEETQYRALEILRGLSQAQQEINNSQKIKVQLQLLDDEDRPETARALADKLVQRPEVLGVVGHNSSLVSLTAAQVYNDKRLPFVAPISITTELTDADRPYIFQTNVQDKAVAKALAEHLVGKRQQKKVAIFFTSKVGYSASLNKKFAGEVAALGGEVVASFDWADNPNPNQSLQKAIERGAEAIALFPAYRSRNGAWNVLRSKQRLAPKLTVLGDIATLYSYDTLNEAGAAAEGMVLGVSWHGGDGNSSFVKESQQMWQASVNWASATSYNALKAMGTALNQNSNPSRETVKNSLLQGEFPGASGPFRFFNGHTDDRITLVKVGRTPSTSRYKSHTGFDFLLLPSTP